MPQIVDILRRQFRPADDFTSVWPLDIQTVSERAVRRVVARFLPLVGNAFSLFEDFGKFFGVKERTSFLAPENHHEKCSAERNRTI